MNSSLPPLGPLSSPDATAGTAASADASIIHIINCTVPYPARERRRRVWLCNGDSLRFAGGIRLTVAMERAVGAVPALWLYFARAGATGMSVTAYTPVSLRSEAGCTVVVRAIAVSGHGEPLAAMLEIDGVDRSVSEALCEVLNR